MTTQSPQRHNEAMSFKAINQATEEVIAEYPVHTPKRSKPRSIVGENFQELAHDVIPRARPLMIRAAEILEEEIDTVGALLTSEMGKTFTSAKAESPSARARCATSPARRVDARRKEDPLVGVAQASATSPRHGARRHARNYALWQAIRFIAPGLMAGNVGILNTPTFLGSASSSRTSSCARAFPWASSPTSSSPTTSSRR